MYLFFILKLDICVLSGPYVHHPHGDCLLRPQATSKEDPEKIKAGKADGKCLQ